MSPSPSHRQATEIADELCQLQEQIQGSLLAFKESTNPTQLVQELVSRPKFPLIAFAVGGIAVAFMAYQFWRRAKPKKQLSKLPRSLQKQLPELREALQIPLSAENASAKSKPKFVQSAGKSLGQVVWKAATPVLISFLRKQIGSWLK